MMSSDLPVATSRRLTLSKSARPAIFAPGLRAPFATALLSPRSAEKRVRTLSVSPRAKLPTLIAVREYVGTISDDLASSPSEATANQSGQSPALACQLSRKCARRNNLVAPGSDF